VYVYGVREDWTRGAGGREVLVARTRPAARARAEAGEWRYRSGEGWEPDLDRALALFDGAATEMSVSYLPALASFVAVYTHLGISGRIVARRAPRPEGPWGPPVELWHCPETEWNPRYFCYAGKAHPELATRGNELIISYACNAEELEDLVSDPRLYWPRFVRVEFGVE